MKTTKLFFMAALALMTVACSNDIDEQPSQQPANLVGIPFTATISVGESAITRALEEDGVNNKILATWKDGEEVALIYDAGSTPTKTVASVTKQTDGTATISATLEEGATNGSDVTIIYPATAADGTTGNVKSDLLSAQDGTLTGTGGTSIAEKYDVRKGTGKLSISTGGATVNNGTPGTTVSLTNQFAIFKLTLGSAIDATHPLVIKDNTDAVITTITPTTSTTTAYVVMEPATGKYFKFSATTAENKIISKSNAATIAAGKYYQTTLAVPALGDLFYSDGTYSTTLQAGKTAIGVIAYLGTDNFTENGTTVGGSAFVGHGLVMCLKNAASDVAWCTHSYSDLDGLEFGSAAMVTNVDGLKRTTNVSGYSNTKKLIESPSFPSCPAASSAWNYTTLPAPTTGTTGWFLPTAQQWVKMQSGLGELNEDNLKTGSWYDNNHPAANKWENALSKAGSGNYDSMKSGSLHFWSSSESDGRHAWYLGVLADRTGNISGFKWTDEHKNNSGENKRVRPVLAF